MLSRRFSAASFSTTKLRLAATYRLFQSQRRSVASCTNKEEVSYPLSWRFLAPVEKAFEKQESEPRPLLNAVFASASTCCTYHKTHGYDATVFGMSHEDELPKVLHQTKALSYGAIFTHDVSDETMGSFKPVEGARITSLNFNTDILEVHVVAFWTEGDTHDVSTDARLLQDNAWLLKSWNIVRQNCKPDDDLFTPFFAFLGQWLEQKNVLKYYLYVEDPSIPHKHYSWTRCNFGNKEWAAYDQKRLCSLAETLIEGKKNNASSEVFRG